MNLTTFEFLAGLFSLIHVVIVLIIAIVLILKYIQVKIKLFLYVGLFLIGIAEPWLPSSISFILILLGKIPLNAQLHTLFAAILIPVFINFWLLAFTDFLYKDKQKKILTISISLNALYEIYYIYWLIVDVNQIGYLSGPLDYHFRTIALIYMISILLLASFTGIWFGYSTISSSNNKENRLRGRLLIVGFVCFFIGGIFDALPYSSEAILITVRLILISSSFLFYFGFLLPKFLQKRIEDS